MTAVAAFSAIRLGSKPADSDHPFGHYKAEFLAAMFVGAMIAVAAVLIMIKAYSGLSTASRLEIRPRHRDKRLSALSSTRHGLGRSSSRDLWRSPALVADGQHSFTDDQSRQSVS